MTQPQDQAPVTFVSPYADIGGAEAYLESLLGSLGPEWIAEVILLEDGEFADRLRELEFPVKVIDAPQRRRGILRGARRLRRELRSNRPEVIHAHQVKAAVVGALASAGTGIPVIWNKVDSALDGPWARLIARGCDQVVGISESTVATFGGSTEPNVHVVHPGLPDYPIDRADGRRLVREVLGVDDDARVIVLSGRLCVPKGQLELIEVAPTILEAHPTAKLAFLGGESRGYAGFEDTLRGRAAELGVERAVAFPGYRSTAIASVADAVRFVAGCDLLVAPSRREERSGWEEGFGLAVVEAMRVGTPVVAYRNGSLPEVLDDCGVIVPEGDRGSLANAVISVLSDSALRDRLVSCGARRSKRYTLEASVAGMKARYLDSAR